MVYVTHDQTEAMTFAEQVVVMHEGAIVQVGTPIALFERPRHTFVGHFIGSPGMNVLPCEIEAGQARFAGVPLAAAGHAAPGARTEIGVRPEFVRFAEEGVPVRVVRVADAGRHQIVGTHHGDTVIRVLLKEGERVPGENVRLAFDPAFTRLYVDGWMAGEAA